MIQGLIRNVNQVTQALDFKNVEFGKIHPSDIDAVIEIDNKYLILIEVKKQGNKMPIGQRLLLERLADKWGKYSIVLKLDHNTNDNPIPLQSCILKKYYLDKEWKLPKHELNALETIKTISNKWNINKLNNINMEQKENSGAIFKNNYKKAETHPDYKGKMNVDGKDKEVALWVRETKNGEKFFSMAISEPYKPQPMEHQDLQPTQGQDDDLPF